MVRVPMLWLKVIHSRRANKGVNPCIEVWVNYSLSSEKGPIRVELDPSERRSGPDWRIRGLSRLSDHPLSCARLALRDIRYAAASDKNLKDLRIPVQEPRQVTSLEEGDEYAHSNEKAVFLRRYWRGLALGPFVLVLVIFHRILFEPSRAWNYGDSLLVVSLGWAILVAIYAMVIFTGLLFVRCPRCGWDSAPPLSVARAVLRGRLLRHKLARIDGGVAKSRAAPATTIIKEDANYGSDQTQNTGNGRSGDGDGRRAARVWPADWERSSCHVLLRKGSRSHPL